VIKAARYAASAKGLATAWQPTTGRPRNPFGQGCDTIVTVPDLSPEQRRELERLAAEQGDELTEQIVLDAARSPDSYLRSLFEWDDAKAAGKYRESWANEQRD
jgi:hypothetical protein